MTPTRRVTGAFINQNHFAHLMALGLGPLMCLVAMQVRHDQRKEQAAFKAERIGTRQIELLGWMLALGIVLFAGLMTFSRGGALAMLLATLVVIGALYSARMLGWRFVAAVATLALIDRRQPDDPRLSAMSPTGWTTMPPARSRNSTKAVPVGRSGTPTSKLWPTTDGSARASAATVKSIRCI